MFEGAKVIGIIFMFLALSLDGKIKGHYGYVVNLQTLNMQSRLC
jgi:hypothetical protein